MNSQHDFSSWLVRRAAAAAPPSLSERLEEEWLADLHTRRGQVSRLWFGLGCCWAIQTIAREFPVKAQLATTAGGSAAVAAYGSHAAPWWPRRPGAMLVIVAFHVVIALAFMSVFRPGAPPHEPPILKWQVLTDPQPKQPPLPMPNPRLAAPHVAPLQFPNQFVFPQDPPPITFGGMPNVASGGSMADISRMAGGPGAGFPNAEEFYPPAAKRLGEQGIAAVRVCVDGTGRLTEVPTVAQSAGSSRLDAGAIRLAQAGSGHYRPATENGLPLSSCYAFRVRFMLQ